MKLKIKSQLPHIEKGGVLDDCGPSSTAAAVSWAHKYTKDFSAGQMIESAKTVIGREDKDGVPEGTNLSQLAKLANAHGAKCRYPKDWADVVVAAKKGAAIIVNVQAPKNYPAQAISAWHKRFDTRHPGDTYGHMICVAFDPDKMVFVLADPTFTGKGKEAYGVEILPEDFKRIASSKGDAPHKRCLIVAKA